ncbi:hypothetical protein [Victivallis vadensis]|uniref:hypothetical protein n=1 Tax=Victivallis vadensis TaxID=172901 RepID=UPI00266BC306|nr:hypothetical protein [Victivallis vadensis]
MKRSWFAKIIGILLILFLCYLGISPFIELAGKRAASVTAAAPLAFYVVIRMAMFGILAAAVFCRIFLPDIADSMVNFLLYPRRLLKKPAPLISPVQGLIRQGKYELALAQLDRLLEERPDCALLWLTRLELLADCMKQPAAAMQTAEAYFSRNGREFAPQNMQLLIRYRELTHRSGTLPLSDAMIATELKKHARCYSGRERRQLRELLQQSSESDIA